MNPHGRVLDAAEVAPHLPSGALIANIALPALPGSNNGPALAMNEIVEGAVADARLLVDAGFDGVLLQNSGDQHITRDGGPATTACLAAIASAIRTELRCLLGVNVLAVGGVPAMAVAHAVGAEFVRIKVFVGAVVTPSGLYEGRPEEVLEFRRRIGAQSVQIVADVHDRSSWPVGTMPLRDAAQAASSHGASVLVITGRSPIESLAMARDVREAVPGALMWCGGGVDASNAAEYLRLYDGLIVAKSIKTNADYTARFDPERVKQFVHAAREAMNRYS